MDIGPCSQRRETSRKRVSSPNAAKSGAEPFGHAVAFELRRLDKVALKQFCRHLPTLLVRRKRLTPAFERDLIEAGLRDGHHDSIRRFLQREDDECGRLRRVVDTAID